MAQTTMASVHLPSREFSVGDVLSKTTALFLRRPVSFFLISLSTWLPLFLIGLAFAALGLAGGFQSDFASGPVVREEVQPMVVLLGLLSIVAIGLFTTLSSAITCHLVLPDIQRVPVRVGSAIGRGFSRLPPLTAMIFLAGVATIIGFVMLVVPGFMLMAMWALAVPVCAYEKLGPVRSLSRSAMLTKGFRWRLFALIMIFFAASFVGSLVQKAGAIIFGPAMFVVGVFIKLVVMSLYNVGVAVAYHELRVIKEGVDLEGVAEVFD